MKLRINYIDNLRTIMIFLLIPFLFGVIFVNPILSYVADKTHNGYNGNYFEHYAVYFTRFTDLTGYDGGFTPGHLWFIAVLMLISCIGYVIIKVIDRLIKNDGKVLCIVDCIIIVLSIISFDITFGGKKIITYLGTYLIGYYLFSKQSFIEKLMKYKGFIITVFIIASVINVVLYVYIGNYEVFNDICNNMSFITGIPALICIGKMYLDNTNEMCSYCSRLSYAFYIVHFPVVVLCQYFISLTGMGCIYNFVFSFVISTIITSGICFFISKITILLAFCDTYLRK